MMDARSRSLWVFWLQIVMWLGWLPTLYAFAAEPNPDMFSRMGSLLVVFGVLFLANHGRNLIAWQIAERLGEVEYSDYRPYYLASVVSEFGFVILGTLVWGFGDLLVCWLHGMEC